MVATGTARAARRMTKYQRARVLEAGMRGEDIERAVETQAMPHSKAILKRDELAKGIIAFWSKVMGAELNMEEMKWGDQIRVSELMARYVGMLDSDEKRQIFNTVNIMNTGDIGERALLERLRTIEDERKALDLLNVQEIKVDNASM